MAQFSIAPISAVLGTAAVAVYTVPAGQEQTLNVSLVNFSTGSAAASIWIVEPGGARGNQHSRISDYILPAKEPRRIVERESFPPGTQVIAGASVATALSIQITGTTRSTA